MHLPARDVPVLLEADVVVAGGGPAGLAAAVAAAETGARTVLCERYGFLGGNFTVASVGTVCGMYVRTAPGAFDRVVGGVGARITDALAARAGGYGPVPFKDTAVFVYVPWAAKRVADALVEAQERLTLLLHALVHDVIVDDGEVRAIVIATKQGPRAIAASTFVDGTGDADVAAFAGAPTTIGPTGYRQHASMQFVMQHVDADAALADLAAFPDAVARHGAHLTRDGGALIPTLRPGEFLGAMTRVTKADGSPIDPTDPFDVTDGELRGRALAEEAAGFVREHVAGFADAFLGDTAPALGIREGRRIVAETTLTGDDVTDGRDFADGVARGAWPQEYHVSGRSTEYRFLPDGTTYAIPFRSLLPVGPRNVVVAGRCIAADHDALASTRVMGPSMALGEAAGVAAALAARDGIAVSGVDHGELRAVLADRGAVL